ncbi:MAG: patatin-like phospholipase family protein [Chitinophagaceae bacterium]|nr:patatin-like phospholipase family protein [Chitinophagaceae bacterium]MCW5929125.1 patatin-like phospholipase family protein [Chitinophagaceae bacterium]
MKPLITLSILAFFIGGIAYGQHPQRPKIGITLSGGGAKGLAHIGILKAIDSAGLNVDYITGTSMGGVIGGLYAIGYSADSIETLAREIDWELLLSNQSSLSSVFMAEKDEYARYILELPRVKHKFKLPTGILEGQELWLKFSELFFPVSNIKDFSKFSIPFKCIATDVGTGEAVVMDNGEVISSIRSSMAIPSFFTAVNVNDRHLIDGGVVRNFPVRDVKEMGAEIVIGSNVSSGLLASNKVSNAIQVLLQVAFFREAEDSRNEIPLCDIYVSQPLPGYNMGSFSSADKIMEAGIEEGKRLYPRLKELADSLDAIYGKEPFKTNRLPPLQKIKFSSFELSGLKNTTIDFFVNTLDLKMNEWYSALDISKMVRHAFGTRYYNRILYSLEEETDGTYKIIFDIVENPLTFAKVGLHYDGFSGISAILNLTGRNFLVTNSRSLVTLNIGDNFRARGQHLQYIGKHKNLSSLLEIQYDRFGINSYNPYNVYNSYREAGLYKRQYTRFDLNAAYSPSRKVATGLGFRMELNHFSPIISSPIEFKGSNNFPTAYTFFKLNSLNKQVFPSRGLKIDAEGGWVFRQNEKLKVLKEGVEAPANEYPIGTHPYLRTKLNVESYLRLSYRSTLLLSMQAGINFNYTNNLLNEFSIGGLIPLYNNQITFAGLPEATTYTPTVGAFMAGYRFEFYPNTYITGKGNILYTNFINKSTFFKNPNLLSGYALTFGYNFALGPLEVSAMYSDQAGKIRTYVSFGIPF